MAANGTLEQRWVEGKGWGLMHFLYPVVYRHYGCLTVVSGVCECDADPRVYRYVVLLTAIVHVVMYAIRIPIVVSAARLSMSEYAQFRQISDRSITGATKRSGFNNGSGYCL